MDVLGPGLKAIFCGINRPPAAVHTGHDSSSPSDRFWSVRQLAGFTEQRLQPREERRLLLYGYGITAVVSRATKRASELSAQEFVAARPRLEAQMQGLHHARSPSSASAPSRQ
jgi:double-stranded uracil-DNA glycosylase